MVLKARRLFVSLLALWSVSFLPGCFFVTTKKEGRELAKRIAANKQRLGRLHQREQQVQRSIGQAREEQKKLVALMGKARKVLLRNSADVGARVEILSTKLGQVLGRLDNVEHDLAARRTAVGKAARIGTTLRMELATLKQRLDGLGGQFDLLIRHLAGPRGPDALFAAGTKAFHAGHFREARRLFRQFVVKYPKDARGATAVFNRALSYFKENKFAAADFSFKDFQAKYPQDARMARSWLFRARCRFELKYCRSALKVLDAVLRRYPKSPEGHQARTLRTRIRRVLHSARFCGS
ncbi:MAG: tetratricopeptide repeat protein [Deltaproteobacteria bacterium]|nr:tetratricopeptide repeat protein [Deltaproteobacteria bacterium]